MDSKINSVSSDDNHNRNTDDNVERWSKIIKLNRILNDDHQSKFIAIEAEMNDENSDETEKKNLAVLLMEKTPFDLNEVSHLFKSNEKFTKDFINDIYHKYTMTARSTCNDVKLNFIYPATDLHIKKYLKKSFRLVSETNEKYDKIVKPYIEKNQLNVQWVYNILDGKSENDRILLDDKAFVVLPDIMWDNKSKESLHVLSIVKERNIKSLRDLTPEHIELLEDVIEKTTNLISSKFDLPSSSIRVFFHYPPSFYHLHVHFTSLENKTCGSEVERARLVRDVIDNLKMMPDYYKKKTLYYKLSLNDNLYELLQNDQ